jgi:hypothetical protein
MWGAPKLSGQSCQTLDIPANLLDLYLDAKKSLLINANK